MKKIIYFAIVALVVVVISFYGYVKLTAAEQGELAPSIETNLIDGSKFKLEGLRGDYVLLNFWGSWCGPCRSENPQLVQLHNKYADKVKIVTYALEKTAKNGVLAAKADGFTWKNQIVEQSSLVLLSQTARDYGVTSIPTPFLISPKGKLMKLSSLDEIEEFLSSL